MKAKLDNKIYRDRAGFEEDFKQMIQNAKTYNAPMSFVFGEAIALEKAFNDRKLLTSPGACILITVWFYRMVKDRRSSECCTRSRDGARPSTTAARRVDKQNILCAPTSDPQTCNSCQPQAVAHDPSKSGWPTRHSYPSQVQTELASRYGGHPPS